MSRVPIKLTVFLSLILLLSGIGCAGLNHYTASAFSTNSANASKQQGISGQITYGPTSPVCGVADSPCYIPYPATMEVLKNGRQVATFTADSQGLFNVSLPKGTYTIQSLELTTLQYTVSPQPVVVSRNQITSVSIMFDSGIR
jgi:hypothetical protein